MSIPIQAFRRKMVRLNFDQYNIHQLHCTNKVLEVHKYWVAYCSDSCTINCPVTLYKVKLNF